MSSNKYRYQNKVEPIVLLSAIFVVIVLFLHHESYTTNYFSVFHDYKINPILQKFAVGGFLFLSGYKLAKSKLADPPKRFITNRFFRLYFLYLLAIVVFSFTAYPYLNKGNFPSLLNFLFHAFALQSIFPHRFQRNYDTLWFISTLFICYGFFLVTRRTLQNFYRFFFALLLTLIIISAVDLSEYVHGANILDPELNTYLAFFAVGMGYSKIQKKVEKIASVKLLLSLFCLSFLSLVILYNTDFVNEQTMYIKERLLSLLSSVSLYITAFKISPNIDIPNQLVKFLKWIYYASFSVFLFHRSLWAVMASVWEKESLFQWLFIVVLGVPVIFLLSYAIQLFHDRTITFVLSRKRN